MAGIQIEQLDIDSLRRFFLDKNSVESLINEIEENVEEKIERVESNVEEQIDTIASREFIMEKLGSLSSEDLTELGIENRLSTYLTKSNSVSPTSEKIDITESDGRRYQITPSRGYVKKDNADLIAYQHPLTHNANEIVQTTDRNFASLAEKTQWNGKVNQSQLDSTIDGVRNDIFNMMLIYIKNIVDRISVLERELDINALENNRRSLVNIINSSLSAICNGFRIIGDGTKNQFTIAHNLSNKDLQVSVINDETMEIVYPLVEIIDFSTVRLSFNSPIANNKSYTTIISAKKEMQSEYPEVNSLLDSILTKYSIVGDNYTREFTITHNFNSKDIFISCLYIGSNSNMIAYPDIYLKDNNYITVEFANAPVTNETYNIYISKTPFLTNVDSDPVIESLTTDPRCTGYNNVNYVCDRLVKSYDLTVPANETEVILQHNNGTLNVQIGIYDKNTFEYTLFPNYTIVDLNSIKVTVLPSEFIREFKVILMSQESIIYKSIEDSSIPVAYIALDKHSISIEEVGGTSQLVCLVEPDNADNKLIHWTSSNENVATVDGNGLITCVSTGGTCYIVATSDDGGYIDSCFVTT